MAVSSTAKSDLPSSHFFRPIVRPLNEGIPLPTSFMERYGDSLGKVVVLKVPTGAEWRVELRRINGETWMRKGLQEFGEFYSIELYHVLVFRYEGKSRFSVVICDKTTFEIDYSVHVKHVEVSDDDNKSVIKKFENRGRKKKNREIEEDRKKPNQRLSSYSLVDGRRLRQRVNTSGNYRGTWKSQIPDDQRALKSEYPSFDFVVGRAYLRPHFVSSHI
ncbi:OLC1v1008391C1 [Oldenlandia corymbosa var. corymbosa]|uniref:OLC1v1008391C1 n=1 Tax=Oldenlandia corymbosa var. corymbosa TaxID=529605 RepID=A0AAV1DLU3_OLDCO|nr:OLC1v1008391C1 [Oldenlandia corymbosa var. corymbosa]